jgi:hypothetical protein
MYLDNNGNLPITYLIGKYNYYNPITVTYSYHSARYSEVTNDQLLTDDTVDSN